LIQNREARALARRDLLREQQRVGLLNTRWQGHVEIDARGWRHGVDGDLLNWQRFARCGDEESGEVARV